VSFSCNVADREIRRLALYNTPAVGQTHQEYGSIGAGKQQARVHFPPQQFSSELPGHKEEIRRGPTLHAKAFRE
jgi:hypothetical protein